MGTPPTLKCIVLLLDIPGVTQVDTKITFQL